MFTFLFVWCYAADIPCMRKELQATTQEQCEELRFQLRYRVNEDAEDVFVGECVKTGD